MMIVSGFDWDEGKCSKHGVSIAEIEALLESGPRIAPDLKHSMVEDRFIAVGRSSEGRPLFVAFTFRRRASGVLIRPLSARYMHQKEIAAYERDEEKGPEV
jgi:uncharacterized DUF497 family protein